VNEVFSRLAGGFLVDWKRTGSGDCSPLMRAAGGRLRPPTPLLQLWPFSTTQSLKKSHQSLSIQYKSETPLAKRQSDCADLADGDEKTIKSQTLSLQGKYLNP